MDTSAAAHVKGWVTFICMDAEPEPEFRNNAPNGFKYSITVKDVPQGTYTVMAYPAEAYLPPSDDILVPSVDAGLGPYTLGTFRIMGNRGRGHLKGFVDVIEANPGVYGLYAWKITVEHSLLGPIAETHVFDAADFLIVP